jgi:hypothetical protein
MKKRTKKRAKRKPAKRKRKPFAIVLRLNATDATGFRALARARDETPARLLKNMVARAVQELQSLPLAVVPVKSRNSSSRYPAFSDPELASLILRVAASPSVTRFHDRAYIASVFEHMPADSKGKLRSLDQFKATLLELHRKGLLRLTRADLVAAMNRDLVERSEARYHGATFHFVALS